MCMSGKPGEGLRPFFLDSVMNGSMACIRLHASYRLEWRESSSLTREAGAQESLRALKIARWCHRMPGRITWQPVILWI